MCGSGGERRVVKRQEEDSKESEDVGMKGEGVRQGRRDRTTDGWK